MFKMYQRSAHKADTPELWEENWETTDFAEALRFCESDPLAHLFNKYARAGSVMLEGGCGMGQYVAFQTSRGVRVVGLDFAQSSLHRLHSREPKLALCAGDVAALPFGDETFDLYYSGGVVEHFESGPEPALLEARRVLRPNGVFLVSVPYFNLLRRVLLPFRDSWKRVRRERVDEKRAANGIEFFQYVYGRRDFEQRLRDSGWRVITTQGYSVLWGLYDAPYLQRFVEKLSGQHQSTSEEKTSSDAAEKEQKPADPGSQSSTSNSHPRSLIHRLVVGEDDSIPVAGLGVRLMRRFCANMMMYVCVRESQ
jgi:SAM-dependent methyltransferase